MSYSAGFGTVGVLLCLALSAAGQDETAKPAAAEFVALYNGKDLSGWTIRKDGQPQAWKATGELLNCEGPAGGWLQTEKSYSDFVLKLEYSLLAGADSGIGLRLPAEGSPAETGLEVQIVDETPEQKDLPETRAHGSIYDHMAAKRVAPKPPGEWNALEITCRGPFVKVALNGETVIDVQLDAFKEAHGEHKPLTDRPESGCIGLQSSGRRIDFRRIEIQDLVTTTKSGLRYCDVISGTGVVVPSGARVAVHYTGRLTDGKKFDSSRDRDQPTSLRLTEVIQGWQEGVAGMKVGGRRKLTIPPELAYGEAGARGVIPPNATLVFDVEVLDVE